MAALLSFAGLLAAIGASVAVMAVRFRQGRARHLSRQPYHGSLWPAARRNLPYGLLPIAGICLLTSASMVAGALGAGGPVVSAVYLLLLAALVVATIVLMVRRPDRFGPGPRSGPPETGEPPRPVSEMTPAELAEWARGDPEKLRRLMRRRRY